MTRKAVAAVVSLLIAADAGAGPAHAAWTAPATLGPSTSGGREATEPGPRVALGADGTLLAAWVRSELPRDAVYAAIGSDRGRFGAAQRLGEGLRPAVAAGADGAGVVVFEGRGGLRISVRRTGARRFSAARVLVTGTTKGVREEFALVGIDAAGTALVVYEHTVDGSAGFRRSLRTLRVDVRTGRARGAIQDLGLASLPRGATLERGAGGGLALLTRINLPTATGYRAGPTQVLTWAPGAPSPARFSPPAPRSFTEEVLSGDGRGQLALAGVRATLDGEAGASGHPIAALASGSPLAMRAPFAGPSVTLPSRTFGAVAAAIPGGRLAMVFQQKDAPAGFARDAPVLGVAISAAGVAGRAVRLSARKGSEPQIVSVGDSAVTVWDDAGRLAAARHTRRGWTRIAPPRGSVVRFHDYVTNRQLVATGSTAVYIWEARSSIRVSVLRR